MLASIWRQSSCLSLGSQGDFQSNEGFIKGRWETTERSAYLCKCLLCVQNEKRESRQGQRARGPVFEHIQFTGKAQSCPHSLHPNTFSHSTFTSTLLWAVFAATNLGDTEVGYEIRWIKGHSYL